MSQDLLPFALNYAASGSLESIAITSEKWRHLPFSLYPYLPTELMETETKLIKNGDRNNVESVILKNDN